MPFGQCVVGPPGSGKSTYCNGVTQFLNGIGRKTVIVNLDPANENMPFEPEVDICELITLEDVMENVQLGPNGGLVYCMEFLEKNVQWLVDKLKPYATDSYFIFDCPGQVELVTHNNSLRVILERLQKEDFKLTCVNLVDAHYCSEASKFISVLLVSLNTMLQLELPHINVLSKVDLAAQYGKLAFTLDYYTEVLDLSHLLQHMPRHCHKKFRRLNKAICEVVEDFGLVSFLTLNIQDKDSVQSVVNNIDKSNGYVFRPGEQNVNAMLSVSAGDMQWASERNAYAQENFLDRSDED